MSSAPGDPVAAAVQALASGGIAVMDDFRSTAPTTALTGTPSAMRFTRWQVQNLVNEAGAHAGYLGTELDGLATAPAGAPPFTTLINAWLTRKDGALATYAAGVMGAFDPKHPEATVYPSIVVLTFIGDIARPAATSHVPHPSFDPERLFAAPAEADGVCTDISAWVSNQVNSITAAIQSNGSGWLSSLWNTVVAVGGTIVSAAFSAIANSVVGFITQIATICGVIMQVSSMFKPWSVQLAGTPSTMQLTSSPGDGTFVATLTAGDVPWPPQLISCVAALSNVNLTDATYKDAPVTWTPKANIPGLATPTTSDATLLENKTATYHFQTATVPDVPANACPRTRTAGNLVLTVSIARSDVAKALTSLETLITNQINPLIRPYLTPYIQSALASANDAAPQFAAPHQTASITVTEEFADPLCPQTPPPGPTTQPTSQAGTASLPDRPCSQLLTAGDTAPIGGGAVFIPTDEQGNKIDVGGMMAGMVNGTLFNGTGAAHSLSALRDAPSAPDYDQKRTSYCVIGIAPDKMFAFFNETPKGSAAYHKDQDSDDALHACRAAIGQALLDHFGADCRNASNSATSSVTIYGPTAEYIVTLFPQGGVTTQSAYAMFRNLLQRFS